MNKPNNVHTIVLHHVKLVGSTTNSFRITGHYERDIKYREVYLRNVRVTGNGGALPAVVYLKMGLTQSQCYFTLAVDTAETVILRDTMVPFFPNTTNDQDRLLASSENGLEKALMNAKIELVSFNTNGIMTPFIDYTDCVVELVLKV